MRVTGKGQITIPPAMRKKHGLLPRAEVELVDRPEGVLVIKAAKLSDGKKVLNALLRGGKIKGRTERLASVDTGLGMILVDTSVIADVLTKDPDWFQWSSQQLESWGDRGPLCYNEVVFAELAVKFDSQKELEHRLSAFTHLPMPLSAAFQAGKAFEKYRRAGGKKARPLPDFFIGAHAYVAHLPLLTRDLRRVRSFFSSVRFIAP